VRGNQTGALRINSGNGVLDVGAQNVSHAHLQTDRPSFYLNKRLLVDEGIVSSYDEDLLLQTAGTTRLYVNKSNGNVGIGYDSPDWKLKVAGNGYFANGLRADDGFVVDDKQVIDSDGGWHRSHGNAGWYNQTYGGGIYMVDSSWVRVYGDKNFLVEGGVVRADNGFQVDGKQVIDGDGGWHRSHGATGWYNETYGGGMFMQDTTWVRVYGGKDMYVEKMVRADNGFQVDGIQVIDGAGGIHGKMTAQCDCISHDVSAAFDNVGWTMCPTGYFMQGLWRGSCTQIYCIEYFHCCRPCN